MRLGGQSQNNLMMDGISAMDTGNNGTMLAMNIESIGEVKILTQGYQAEYGRSTGLQVTAVTKSGTNRFRGSFYDVERDTSWNSNSWVNKRNGDPKPIQDENDWGYSIGGPIGKPGGDNKLFFFYSHEYRPRNTPLNGGNPIRLRVPTQAERNGDFSQSLDQNGAFIGAIKSPITGQNYPNNVIPQSELYTLGQRILNRYPLPNRTQTAGTNYNYEATPCPGGEPHAAAGDPHRLPAQLEAAHQREVFGPARAADHVAGTGSGVHRREHAVPLHHQLRSDGELHHQPDDVPRRHLRVHPQRADRRQRGRRARHRRREPADRAARLPAPLPECGSR